MLLPDHSRYDQSNIRLQPTDFMYFFMTQKKTMIKLSRICTYCQRIFSALRFSKVTIISRYLIHTFLVFIMALTWNHCCNYLSTTIANQEATLIYSRLLQIDSDRPLVSLLSQEAKRTAIGNLVMDKEHKQNRTLVRPTILACGASFTIKKVSFKQRILYTIFSFLHLHLNSDDKLSEG